MWPLWASGSWEQLGAGKAGHPRQGYPTVPSQGLGQAGEQRGQGCGQAEMSPCGWGPGLSLVRGTRVRQSWDGQAQVGSKW